jgi:catabolite regulation protein CreA
LKPTFRVDALLIFKEARMKIYEEAKNTIIFLASSYICIPASLKMRRASARKVGFKYSMQ